MREYTSSVSPKGQITLPIAVRRRFGVKAKDKIIFEVEGDEVRLRAPRSRVDEVYRSVPALDPPCSYEAMEALVQDEVARAAAEEGR